MPCDPKTIPIPDYHNRPYVKMFRRGVPFFRGPCPVAGGVDRFDIYPDGDPRTGKRCWVCNCGAAGLILDHKTGHGMPTINRERIPLDPGLNNYYKQFLCKAENYYSRKGISKAWMERAELGYAPQWAPGSPKEGKYMHHYTAPCYMPDSKGNPLLWGIQYRNDIPDIPKRNRYFSHPDGHDGLFGTLFHYGEKLPYKLVVEGWRDALALWSLGFPALAVWQLNTKGVVWRMEWNRLLGTKTVVVIGDNDADGGGGRIANMRASLIPGSSVKIPRDVKDSGEMIDGSANPKQEIAAWLGLPPLENL